MRCMFKTQSTTLMQYGYFSLKSINNNHKNFVIECFAATNPPFNYLFLNENFGKINQILSGQQVSDKIKCLFAYFKRLYWSH